MDLTLNSQGSFFRQRRQQSQGIRHANFADAEEDDLSRDHGGENNEVDDDAESWMFSDSDFSSEAGPDDWLAGDDNETINTGFDPSMHRDVSSRHHQAEQSIMSALPLIDQPDMKNIENAFVMSLRAK